MLDLVRVLEHTGFFSKLGACAACGRSFTDDCFRVRSREERMALPAEAALPNQPDSQCWVARRVQR
eukprot:11206227-Lingulodinium_polyedra.AAC.1